MNTKIKTMTNQVDSMIAKVDAMNQKLESRQNLSERANARLRDIMQSGEPVPTAGKVDIIDALRSVANQSNPA